MYVDFTFTIPFYVAKPTQTTVTYSHFASLHPGVLRWLDPVFLAGYHPTLKLSGIPTFTFIVSLTHRMDNI